MKLQSNEANLLGLRVREVDHVLNQDLARYGSLEMDNVNNPASVKLPNDVEDEVEMKDLSPVGVAANTNQINAMDLKSKSIKKSRH